MWEAPVCAAGKEMEYYGNHLMLIGDDNVKPEDPPHCCFLLPELPENLVAAVLRICPEKYIALRDGMNKAPSCCFSIIALSCVFFGVH